MIIANPIYDVVFKRLMENEKVAKFFISTLMDCEIEEIEVRPQEFTYSKELIGLSIFRLDFIATIKTEEGYKKILIEVQKAFDDVDIMRFRNYLAEQYKKEDVVNGENSILPITTIYILGFKIPEIHSACIKVAREYFDMIERKVLETKSDFVEKLTHDCYIVQVERISSRVQTKLDKLLSLFEQSNFIDKEDKTLKDYTPVTEDVEELKIAADILHHAGADPEQRKLIEIEQEAWRSVNALFRKKERELKIQLAKEKLQKEQEKQRAEQEKQRAEQEKQRSEQEKQRAEQEKKRAEQEKQRAEQEKQRAEQEKQRAEQEHKKLMETVKLLKSLNIPIELIMEKTGLTKEEIEKL